MEIGVETLSLKMMVWVDTRGCVTTQVT